MAILEALGEFFLTVVFEGAIYSIPVKIYEWITGKETGLNGYRTEQKVY